MKKLAIALAFVGVIYLGYSACTTQTVFIDGKVLFCQTCCDGSGNCTTFCF